MISALERELKTVMLLSVYYNWFILSKVQIMLPNPSGRTYVHYTYISSRKFKYYTNFRNSEKFIGWRKRPYFA